MTIGFCPFYPFCLFQPLEERGVGLCPAQQQNVESRCTIVHLDSTFPTL